MLTTALFQSEDVLFCLLTDYFFRLCEEVVFLFKSIIQKLIELTKFQYTDLDQVARKRSVAHIKNTCRF